MSAAWGWIRSYRTDVTLFLGASLFFGLFAHNSVFMESRTAGVFGPIGRLLRGTAKRKSIRDSAFVDLVPVADLHSGDKVWVGDHERAEIAFDDGTSVILGANTLVFLKRRPKGGKLTTTADVLKGEVRVTPSFTWLTEEPPKIRGAPGSSVVVANGTQATPSSAPEPWPVASQAPAKPQDAFAPGALALVHPRPDTVFALIGKTEARIAFSWNHPFRGTLVIRSAEGKEEVSRQEIRDLTYGYVTLRSGHAYQWQLLDVSGKGASEVRKLELRPYDVSNLRQFIRSSGSNEAFEIIQ